MHSLALYTYCKYKMGIYNYYYIFPFFHVFPFIRIFYSVNQSKMRDKRCYKQFGDRAKMIGSAKNRETERGRGG